MIHPPSCSCRECWMPHVLRLGVVLFVLWALAHPAKIEPTGCVPFFPAIEGSDYCGGSR